MDSNEISYPLKNIELYKVVELEPHQLNNDIYISLKEELNKSKGKCNKYGYLNEIHKITDKEDGLLKSENFNGIISYNVTYLGEICNVASNQLIVGNIDIINKTMIRCSNGPLLIIIKINDYNSDYFKLNSRNELYYNNEIIKIDDKVVIKVQSKHYHHNDTRILVLGYMDRISDTEVKMIYLFSK